MHGLKDTRVNRKDLLKIYDSLKGYKEIKYFNDAGHESYYSNEPEQWIEYVQSFLNKI